MASSLGAYSRRKEKILKAYKGTWGPRSTKPERARGHQKAYRDLANRQARARMKAALRTYIDDPDRRDLNDFQIIVDHP
jgi:ribosomal protein L20